MPALVLTHFEYYPVQVELLINEPHGGMSVELEAQGQRLAGITRANLSHPYEGRASRNPAPGPPKRRTGDLVDSVTVQPPQIGFAGLVEVLLTSTSVHRGLDYSLWLRENGYQFIFDDQFAD